jgi:hypothetical protein
MIRDNALKSPMPLMRSTQTKVTSANLAQRFSALSPHIQRMSLFYNMSQNHANPSLNSKTDFCQYPALFNQAIQCNESRPIRCGIIGNDPVTMTSERSTPANERSYITSQDQDRSISH